MAFNPTAMQRLAIDTDGGVLVSAAAGSGKTAVLAERVIRKLTDPVSPVDADRLLIVTFTNAAAAEMRLRIEKRLFEECRKYPESTALLRQSRLISSAKICTIDSFCIELVRENFEKCGVEPDFKVSDGTDLSEIDNSVMSGLILEQIENPTPAFKKLLEITGCEYDEKKLSENIKKVFLYTRQLPFPERYIRALEMPYEMQFEGKHPWYSAAFDIALEKLGTINKLIIKMADAVPSLEKGGEKCQIFVETYVKLFENLSQSARTRDWDGFYAALKVSGVGKQPSLSKSDPAADIIRGCNAEIKSELGKLTELFRLDINGIDRERRELLPAVSLFCALVCKYANLLFEKYRQENMLTFYNTEQLALGLLCEYKNGNVSVKDDIDELLSRFDEVMVDEFQDVNDLQDMLFEILSGGGKRLFVVGDVKQSIYGFRGSNPENFLNRKHAYAPVSEGGQGKQKVVLSDNFRSRDEICRFANYFFSLFLQGQVSRIIYNEEERLNAAAKFPDVSEPPVQMLVVSDDGEGGDSLIKQEGKAIAEYIKKALSEDAFIRNSEGGLRKADYNDFAILLNAVSGKAAVIAEELKAYGIPVACGSEAFAETVEIKTFSALLSVIDNPGLDVELLTVMLSPVFAFTAEEVAVIRSNNRHTTLFSNVIAAAESGNAHAAELCGRLAQMRKNAALFSVGRLTAMLLEDTDYLNMVSAMPNGGIRRENLLTVLRLAEQYTKNGKTGISGFLRLLKNIPDKAAKGASGSGGVRIMSMHASKGLQFPVCIIADISSRLNREDSIAPVLCSDKNGIGFRYVSEAEGCTNDTLPHKLNSRSAAAANIEERLRLLYVAVTRAEDRLVFVSSARDISASLNRVGDKISGTFPYITAEWLASSSCMNDWLLASVLLHRDGETLRRICDAGVSPLPDDGSHIKVLFSNSAKNVYDEREVKNENITPNADTVKQLKENFSYSYPYEYLCSVRSKASVSELANAAGKDMFAYTERPAFMEKNGLSAAARGTAMHHIMQFFNFSAAHDTETELRRLADNGFITETEYDSADRSVLNAFFASNIFSRILASRDVRREMRFLTEVPASVFSDSGGKNCDTDPPVIIQGAVDLCFAEDDGVVVLDFKTDRVSHEETLAQTYSGQLGIYAAACEKIFKKRVKEKIIYSFALSKEIPIE